MVEYIKKFIFELLKGDWGDGKAVPAKQAERSKVLSPVEGWKEVLSELDRLDPRDFEPSGQTDLLIVRANLRVNILNFNTPQIRNSLEQALPVLDSYRGSGGFGTNRSFAFLSDFDLRTLVENDYRELRLKLFPSGAWKATVILSGSILEAVLYDRLGDIGWNGKAIASTKAPKDKHSVTRPIDDWKLFDLIEVAIDIGRLPSDPADTIHQVLRDYRNFIHPKKQIRSKHTLDEAEAFLAVGALDSVCNYFEKNP